MPFGKITSSFMFFSITKSGKNSLPSVEISNFHDCPDSGEIRTSRSCRYHCLPSDAKSPWKLFYFPKQLSSQTIEASTGPARTRLG